MKTIKLSLLLLLVNSSVYSQEMHDKYIMFIQDSLEWKTNGIDTIIIVDEMPLYKGGEVKLVKYLERNLDYPEAAYKEKVEGVVKVGFIVDIDGAIVNVSLVKGVRYDLDNEALRVIREMPKWIPGKQKGKRIRVKYVLPISFRL